MMNDAAASLKALFPSTDIY